MSPTMRRADLEGPAVLIVDDNLDLAENLKEVLEDEGVLACLAANGQEALALLEQFEPQMVVTDMRMPGMSGVHLIKQIRTQHPKVPVVLITAYSQDQQLTEARALGVIAVLQKPLDLDRLCALVGKLGDS
ncbi:MAG: response regulator [Bradymonadia bacterium]